MEIYKLPSGVTQEQALEIISEAIGSSGPSIFSWSDGISGLMTLTADTFYYIDVKKPEKKNRTIPIDQMQKFSFPMGVIQITGDFKSFSAGAKKDDIAKLKELAPQIGLPIDVESTVNEGINVFFDDTKIVYSSLTKKYGFNKPSQEVFKSSSTSGKPPWLVVAAGTDGALAAYEDELIIAKTGAMTGFMSSATGGGRITHFPYRQIVAIEYNGGFTAGVLEVLTASYDGGMNKDNWGIKAPNSSGGDPRQQNNTLPIMKSTYKELSSDLNRIRQLIEKSHEVKISADSISIAAPQIDLIAQIQKLAELKDSGILSVEEFESAKQKLLGQI